MGRVIYESNSDARSAEVYQEAANELRMAIRIIEGLDLQPDILAEIYYYGGKAIALSQYPSKEDAESEAIRCFNVILDDAPGSVLASYARVRIDEIENGEGIKH